MKALLTALLFLPAILFSQNCTCLENLEWLIETFEKNDAGFQYVIDQKGMDAYDAHNVELRQKAGVISDVAACAELMTEWTRFFRPGHIGIQLLTFQQNAQTELSDSEIMELYKNAPSYEMSDEEVESYLALLPKQATMEGIWQSGSYKIMVVKNRQNDHWEYVGFVVEADGVYWQKGQIKFQIGYADKIGNRDVEYFMRDHSVQKFTEAALVGNNILKMGFVDFERVFPLFPEDPVIAAHFEIMNAQHAFIEKLSGQTVFLRIPSFNYSNKKFIDSLLTANHSLLSSSPNLIIDLRYNGGGSDASYYGILPYIYTNPIRTVGVELLSTPQNNKRMEDFMADPDWSESEKEWAKNSLAVLNESLGEFVNLDSTVVELQKFDSIMPYPKNVGVIINEGCGSTTEQFLLAAKQSRKVKLFGTTTVGVLDISNMYHADSPCEEMQLWYSLSRSMRIPDFTIDEKGIQPDYYIDRSVSVYEWLDFVQQVLEE